MSAWRRKALECFPELRKDIEKKDTSLYEIFSELLTAALEAHKDNDKDRLRKIYDFAEWCFRAKEKELWNAAGVSFYEHLGDHEEIRNEMPQWVSSEIYKDIRGLLELRISKQELSRLDKNYL